VDFSISVDSAGRVNGICPDDLSGGPGWARVETDLTPQTELYDARGVALYKLVDGAVVARTPEDMDADAPAPLQAEPTQEERLKALEAAMLDVLLGGVSG